MGTIWVKEFTGGLDARRLPETSKGGTLIVAENGHINRGGEFEQRAAFVPTYTLPASLTKSLGHNPTSIYVFGHIDVPTGIPVGVAYQQLVHPSDNTIALVRVPSYSLYKGKIYAAGEFADGTIAHYYDGVLVADWYDGKARARLTVSAGTAGGSVTAIKVGGVDILGGTVNWNTDPATTASDIVTQINTYNSTPEYTATLDGKDIVIAYGAGGTAANGLAVATTSTNVTITAATTMTGGTDLTGTDFKPGAYVRQIKRKMNSLQGQNWFFSGINSPTKWQTDTAGAGFIDMSSETDGSENLVAIAPYQTDLAVFSQDNVQIWSVDPDPTLYAQRQVLSNTGTSSPKSVTQFGDADLFYAAESGLRSLRARDASNAAATTDIGSPIDDVVQPLLASLTDDERRRNVFGLIEPRDGRFWLIIKDRIFVFSFFPGAKISAWSVYTTGFVVEDAVVFRKRVYLRSGDTIYVYGGTGNARAYDATPAVARLPFLDGDAPAKHKTLAGVDVACRGTWEIRMAMNPTAEGFNASDKIGTVTDSTYFGPQIGAIGETTHFSPILTSSGPGPHRLSSVAIHYMMHDSDDS